MGSPTAAELLDRCSFPAAGTAVTCAVSGGADSLALLVLAVESGCRVTAVHVDHGLRPGSSTEADVVAAASIRFGATFRSQIVVVDRGANLEARARAARFAVLPADVLTGHTADDQAETVLVNLLRGSGIDGLAGMRRDRHPLLGLRRSETAALCAALDLDVVSDPMNDDHRFQRVRIRHELLPLLESIAGRDVVPILARQADHLRGVAELLSELADGVDPTDARTLHEASPAIAAVALRSWIQRETGSSHPTDSASIDRVMAVVANRVRAAEVNGGYRVARTAQRLRIEPPANDGTGPGSRSHPIATPEQ
ncbi:MAG: tRNA lysidine(34) synthetase TilS [Acidimicrobiia bacterium]|nr:tRNA lysidine(34) synthetase TilS [Acidimicrobiia bacterium]